MRIPVCRSVSTAARSKTPDLPRRSCPAFAGVGVVDPGPRRVVVQARLGAIHGPAVNCERAARRSGQRRLQACGRRGPLVVHPSHEDRQDRESLPGPLVMRDLRERISFCRARSSGRTGQGAAHRASAPDPPSPTGRCRDRTHELPPGRPGTSSPFAHFGRLPVRAGNVSCLGKHALFPGCGDLGARCSEAIPEWWRSRSRQNSNPS